jgi:hypothetical protein
MAAARCDARCRSSTCTGNHVWAIRGLINVMCTKLMMSPASCAAYFGQMSPKMHLPHCTNICTAHQFIAVKWCLRLQACASGHAAWLAAYSISADTQPQPASGPAEAAAGHPAADEVPSDSCAGVVSHRASSAVSTSRNAQPHRLERRLWTATPALWIPQGIPSEQHAGPVCPRRCNRLLCVG